MLLSVVLLGSITMEDDYDALDDNIEHVTSINADNDDRLALLWASQGRHQVICLVFKYKQWLEAKKHARQKSYQQHKANGSAGTEYLFNTHRHTHL